MKPRDDLDERAPLCKPSSGIGRLGTAAILSIVFFNVSGGPIGSEGVVRDGGPLVGLVALVLVVLLYSLPQALMTAELSTAFPRNGGYSIWVKEAFGNFWSLQESYYSWGSGVVDNALYPILLYSSAQSLFTPNGGLAPRDMTSCQVRAMTNDQASGGNPSNLFACVLSDHNNCAPEYFGKLAIMVVFTLPVMLTNRSFGVNMVMLMVLVIMPFVVMCAIGVTQMQLSNLMVVPSQVNWHALFNVVFWNVTGFDCCSTFAGELEEPKQKTLPRALSAALITMLLCYLLPLGIGAAVDKEWHCWTSGSLPHVAQFIGGNWLGFWVLASSLMSTWAMYGAELFEDSYQLLGMSEAGLLPSFFAGRSSLTGTPINAITFQVIIICIMLGLDFSEILVIDNFFYCAASLIEFLALLKLRIYRPELVRPYEIPLGTAALAVCCAPAILMSVVLLYTNATQSRAAACVCVGGILLGLPLCAYGAYKSSDVQFEAITSTNEESIDA